MPAFITLAPLRFVSDLVIFDLFSELDVFHGSECSYSNNVRPIFSSTQYSSNIVRNFHNPVPTCFQIYTYIYNFCVLYVSGEWLNCTRIDS